MDTNTAAENILRHLEAVYQPTHCFVPAHLRDFKHLDRRWYEEMQRVLEGEGFRWLSDEEDVTLRHAPGNVLRPVLQRLLVAPDGATMAACYHPRAKWWAALLFVLLRFKYGRTIDLETEYDDGSWVTTSTGMAAAPMATPPMMHTEFLPMGTTPAELLARHRLRLSTYAEVNASARPRRVENLEHLHAAQNRQNALKAAFREEVGGITLEELEATAGSHKEIAQEVHRRIRELRPLPV